MKKILMSIMILAGIAIVAQDATIAEKDVPKKVVAARNKKAAALKRKGAQWTKNAQGEYVLTVGIGKSSVEGPEQNLTARFKEDGTWISTENVLDAYNEKLKKRMVTRNVQAACNKRADGGPIMMGGVTITETPKGKTFELMCGEGRVTFDAKAKEVK
ncbi:MAG: hypothetical protein JSR44_14975 [Spirochaetes bacterium]|nr:hypothetical protein [Spirochaetota bacterium]